MASASNLDAPSMVMDDLVGDTQSEAALRMIVVFGGIKRIKNALHKVGLDPAIRVHDLIRT